MYVQKMRAELGKGNKNEDQDIILRFFKVMSSYSLCCGNPSSFGQHTITNTCNSTHKQKFKREKSGTVTGKQAENRQWGLSVLDIPQPGLSGGSEGQGESAAGAWGGMVFHECIAD